jgi:hypothetical protein
MEMIYVFSKFPHNTQAGLGDSKKGRILIDSVLLQTLENSVFINQSFSEPLEWIIEHPPRVLQNLKFAVKSVMEP